MLDVYWLHQKPKWKTSRELFPLKQWFSPLCQTGLLHFSRKLRKEFFLKNEQIIDRLFFHLENVSQVFSLIHCVVLYAHVVAQRKTSASEQPLQACVTAWRKPYLADIIYGADVAVFMLVNKWQELVFGTNEVRFVGAAIKTNEFISTWNPHSQEEILKRSRPSHRDRGSNKGNICNTLIIMIK